MVQEQLTCHKIEWEVVESPSQNTHTNFVVETFESDIGVVTVATLPSKDREALDNGVNSDQYSRAPPDHWVTDQVDLTAAEKSANVS